MSALPVGVSVVVPVYRSTDSLRDLVDRVATTLNPVGPYEVLLVDDGSPPDTWAVIEHIASQRPEVQGIKLGRNYGQHNALLAGVRAARLPIVVTIDDDLQNPPEEIPRLVNELLTRDLEVVYGVPETVAESLPRRLAGRMTRATLSRGLGVSSAPEFSSFRAFTTRSREAFSKDIGPNVSLDALLTWGSDRFGSVTVRHNERVAGRSNYSLTRLFRFAIDTITGYSTLPLHLATLIGLATALFGLVVLVAVVVRPLVTGNSVPGFPFLASTIAIFAGAQLVTLGIFGEYLARMHFRIMGKPTYLVVESTSDAVSDTPDVGGTT